MADQNDDMDQPATRRELMLVKNELRSDIERMGNSLIEFVRRVFAEFRAEMQAMRVELAQHANAIKEHVTRELRSEIETKASSAELRAFEQKYADLPTRVTKLERAAFPPQRRRRR